MMLLDANLLIYAIDADSAHHERVRPWWEDLLSGPETVGLPWVVILAFLRITTHPRIMQRPLPVNDALAYVERWLAVPGVELVDAPAGLYPQLAAELRGFRRRRQPDHGRLAGRTGSQSGRHAVFGG